MRRFITTPVLCVLLFSHAYAQQLIRQQPFDDLDPTQSLTQDSLQAGEYLTNAGSFNVTGPGWKFQTSYHGPDDKVGPAANESGDHIGVNKSTAGGPNLSPSGNAVSTGDYNFKFNDGDNIIRLTLEQVDVSAYTDLQFSCFYWLNEATYEGSDHLYFILSDGNTEVMMYSLDHDSLSVATHDMWLQVEVNLFDLIADHGLKKDQLSIIIEVSNNANDENVFVDDLQLTGNLVLGNTAHTDKEDIKIYPIPTSDYLSIHTDILWEKLTILDIHGTPVIESYTNKSVDVSNLQAGMYWLQLTTREDFIVQKAFLKN